MHDALAYAGYDVDTQVADVDEFSAVERPIVARTRSDGALTMHVYTLGKWHRRLPDLSHTACGVRIDGQRNPVRREELAGDLCVATAERPGCFTAFELELAATNNRKDRDQ